MADFLDGVKHAFRCLALILLLPVFLVALLLVGLQNLWNSTR
jgi:hypothetical protein